MTKEELNAALYGKMQEEQATYKDRLESLPPNEIRQHSHEYTVRQDILSAMEFTELKPKQCEALLRSPCPISDILQDFDKKRLR